MLKSYIEKLDTLMSIVKQIPIEGRSVIGYNDIHISNIINGCVSLLRRIDIFVDIGYSDKDIKDIDKQIKILNSYLTMLKSSITIEDNSTK